MLNLPSTRPTDRPVVAAMQDVGEVAHSDWRAALPLLAGTGVTLRNLRVGDAPTLLAMLTTAEVARFISPPPTTVQGFERFIRWTQQQAQGHYVCFGIVPAGCFDAVGLIQVRALDAHFGVSEWGFAIGSAYWGKGVFQEAAELVLEFVFETIGVHRLEARAAVVNGRGNGALLKIRAVQEAVLRKSFLCHGQYVDQTLYSILAEEWRSSRDGGSLKRLTPLQTWAMRRRAPCLRASRAEYVTSNAYGVIASTFQRSVT
jgi:ribosomal-protein-alanine N-acetyltransferase